MKYSYLIHAEGTSPFTHSQTFQELGFVMLTFTDAEWQVKTGDKNTFVFNTEAHPVRVKHT